VLEEFDRPFDADPATLQLYKKVLVTCCHCVIIWQIDGYVLYSKKQLKQNSKF